ncbi:MAG: AI-2E family transporter, partial [Candidatus Poribacteria bacterium]|nr:AI-2E family transporter [Candidatus Poribacteria bacterium]
ERSIVAIAAVEDSTGNRTTYVASTTPPNDETETPDKADLAGLEPMETAVHWHLEGSSLGWEPLPPITQIVYTLAGPETTDRKVNGNAPVELYAGTSDGLYTWNRLDNWRKVGGTTQITLLGTAPSGLYAGDSTRVRHRIESNDGWKPIATNKKGVTDTYKDEPIVQQGRAYLTERIPTIAQTGGEVVKWVSGFVRSLAFGFGGFLATLLLAFVVFVYANQSFDNYFRGFVSLLPESRRDTVKRYLREIDKNLQQFLKGQVTVIAIISAISCVAYSLVGVPFALVVGVLAGICNAIPTVGPFIGGGFALLAMLMGLAAGDFSLVEFLVRSAVVVGVVLGVQTIDNSLISPKVMSDAVNVDPLLIMFAVIVGATVLGFWGVLLAIPIIVVIKSIIAVSRTLATDQSIESRSAEADALEEN